jgi:hypothetical protein
MTHSFYVVMGGFAFDTSKLEKNFLPRNKTRITVARRGLHYLASHEPMLIPDVSEGQIQDKSKGSALAKFIVCLQALWFCIQCIARLASRMSITLLELNTFAHALCTLLIYSLWWDKPLDVEEPTLVDSPDIQEVGAAMCVVGQLRGELIRRLKWCRNPSGPPISGYTFLPHGPGLAYTMAQGVTPTAPNPVYVRHFDISGIYEWAEVHPME